MGKRQVITSRSVVRGEKRSGWGGIATSERGVSVHLPGGVGHTFPWMFLRGCTVREVDDERLSRGFPSLNTSLIGFSSPIMS